MTRLRETTAVAAVMIAAMAGTANAGILDINITGAFNNHNWDNSSGWNEGEEWGWYLPNPENSTAGNAWANETWIAGGPARLRVEVFADEDPDVTITKNLINTTGFAWTGFTIDLNFVSGFGTPSAYPGSLGSSRFSSNSTVNDGIGAHMTWSMSGGDTPVLPGQNVSFFFTFNIPGAVVFEMVQTPVPVPGALGLLGLGGLVAFRRRRAA